MVTVVPAKIPLHSHQTPTISENKLMFQPVTNGISVVMNQKYHEVTIANVLHYKSAVDPIPLSLLQDICTNLWTHCGYALRGMMSNEWKLESIVATDISNELGLQAAYGPGGGLVGTLGAGLPGNVAGVVSLMTAYRGRSFRGRIYFSGIPESLVSGNTLDATWAAAASDFTSGLRTLSLSNIDLAVCSRVHNGVKRTVGIVTPVTDYFVNRHVDSQRRRTA